MKLYSLFLDIKLAWKYLKTMAGKLKEHYTTRIQNVYILNE